ncbi:diacylglycerol kinase family protein [Quadrisphaera sp. DSM 44207]|uniref:diacylglycerol/lipid kinase family protein n=1 Tax=Quadrisphaera sp. DSM 44207 TaxID=1881057 RepID=UPI0015A24E78|nr:diacylglycerol kinase family protein [Quadrisphaera sp. DSM 44207]
MPAPGPEAGVLAVVNGSAGSARPLPVARAMSVLRATGDVELVATGDRTELADALASLHGRRLVVMGGDGSLHAVVQALQRAGTLREAGPVGVVPLGTGNDLARSLGLPLDDPEAAARAALHGRAADMELMVEDGGGVVVNAVHAGIGVAATQRAARAKPLLGRGAYPAGALAAGVVRPWHLRVTVDGRVVHDGRSPVLMVAASIGTTIGGGAPVSPGSIPHDGVVDVIVSTSTGPLARIGYASTLLRGRHVERRDVATTRGGRVVLEAVDGRPFATNADGETSERRLRWGWRTVADAWQVVLP